MPAPPGMSQEEYTALKRAQKEKQDLKAAEYKYTKKYAPDTVVEGIDTETLEGTWMKDGEWGAAWGMVEFVRLSLSLLLSSSLSSLYLCFASVNGHICPALD
jgi:hypothetical protein